MKEQFLNNEIWTLTVSASFQRASVYEENVTDNQKQILKADLREFIDENIVIKYIEATPTQDAHLKNINKLINRSKKHKSILSHGQLNFGVGQKMLNLYLKYQWCLDNIVEPPHFPVDRLIQEELNKKARAYNKTCANKEEKIQIMEVKPWTKFKKQEDYLDVINFAKTLQIKVLEYNSLSLPEIELDLFENRRA